MTCRHYNVYKANSAIISLLICLAVPCLSNAALFQSQPLKTVDEAKQKVKYRIHNLSLTGRSYSAEEVCHERGIYIFRNEVIDYPPQECIKDADLFLAELKRQQETEKEASRVEEENRRAAAEEKKRLESAELAKKEAEEKQRIADLKSGRRAPTNFEEVMVVYEASDGGYLASAPKVRPDGAGYGISGKIAIAREDDSFIASLNYNSDNEAVLKAIRGYNINDTKYFGVKIPDSLKQNYYRSARIGAGFNVVGRYIENQQYKTVAGQTMSMPVFDAVYFKSWEDKTPDQAAKPVGQQEVVAVIPTAEQPQAEPEPALPKQSPSKEQPPEAKDSAWTADWGSDIRGFVTTEKCSDAEFLQQGYTYQALSSIPISRLKKPTDSWFVSDDRAITVMGCWFKKEDRLLHLKMRRKVDNKIFEQDINLEDGSWTKVE
jgi:hypothetical protein